MRAAIVSCSAMSKVRRIPAASWALVRVSRENASSPFRLSLSVWFMSI